MSAVERVLAGIGEAASLPLSRATTLPREAYVDQAYFEWEAETVLRRGWLCVAHVSQLAEPGHYVRLDLLDEPLLVLRGRDGVVRVLSRVCPHRAMDIMPDVLGFTERGETKSLVCPYHRWSFDADGTLKGCPEMHRVEGFEKSAWRLAAIRAEIWHGFVFVNLDGDASPLAAQYAAFGAMIAPWRPEDMQLAIAMAWDCPFNWKVMVENWIESYHHLGIHHTTLNPTMPAAETWTEPERPYFIRCHLPYTPEFAQKVRAGEAGGFAPVPGLSEGQRGEWGLYVGLPCFMFLTAQDRVIWYRLQPVSAERCLLLTTTLVTREATQAPDYAATLAAETEALRAFHVEDMQVNTAVQHGLRSRHVVRGRLSHLEEPVWLMQRYLAACASGER